MEAAVEQPETHVLVRHLETAALTGDGAEAHPLTAALAARPPSAPALRGPPTRWMAPVEVRLATTVLLQRGTEIVARQADIVGIPELTAVLDVKEPSPPMVLV